MSRRPRADRAGAWWHLFNRGIAKRPVFETAQDVERFFALLGKATEAGDLEVHAYSVLTTHFHLLARSPRGAISGAMKLVTNGFVRWFNRTRERDGPLFRGRFGGRRIDDGSYWLTVLRYIDLNAPRARLCEIPSDHVHASARAYRHGAGPPWLRREAVELAAGSESSTGTFRADEYDAFASACDADMTAYVVERAMERPSVPIPRFADLVRAASLQQQGWMEWKAALADGVAPGAAFLAPVATERAAEVVGRALGHFMDERARSDVGKDLSLALLHTAAGLDLAEVARRRGVGRSTVHDALRRHRHRLATQPVYSELVSRTLRTAVRRNLPAPTHAFDLPMRVPIGVDEPVVVAALDSRM